MASSYLLPHCGVCKSTLKYGGPGVYLLPCLHSTCNNCLKEESTTISCSHCGETFSKQDYIFLKDCVTQSEIFHSTLKNKPSEIRCTNKIHKNIAVVWCKDCQVLYCKSCQVAHSQIKSSHGHEMVLLKDLSPEGTLGEKSKCPDHDTYVLDLYDTTCEILICSKCARTDHKQCQNEELKNAGREDKDLLLKDQVKLEKKLRDVISQLEYIDTKQKKSETRTGFSKRAISHQFDTIRALITKREMELMNILDQKHREINADIKKANNRIEKSAEKIQAAHDYTKKLLARNSPEDFLMLKNNVKLRAERCVAEDLAMVQTEEIAVLFSKEKLDELKALVGSTGLITDAEGDDSGSDSLYVNSSLDTVAESQQLIPAESAKESEVSKVSEQAKSIDNQQAVEDLQAVEDESYVNVQTVPENNKDSNTHRVSGTAEREDTYTYSDFKIADVPSCPKLVFDIERVNTKKAHINNEGFLLNAKLPPEKMLTTYVGTTSILPLSLTELSYWEVETDIAIDEQMESYGLLMEIGVASEIRDKPYCVSGQPSSRSLAIAHCSNHKGICAKLWNNGSKIACKEDVMFNKAGESYTLKHGVLYEGAKDVLVFFDLIRMEQIATMKGQGNAGDLWPMFGVFSPTLASVKMRLVAGTDVLLTDEKLSLFEGVKR